MLKHVVTDLHQAYLTEMEAKIKPQMGKQEPSGSSAGGSDDSSTGGGDEQVKKQARQLVYDTRYKARREDIPLERAWSQTLQNSSASAPVKALAKSMLFKEDYELTGEEKTENIDVSTPEEQTLSQSSN